MIYISHYWLSPICVVLWMLTACYAKSFMRANRRFVRLERVNKSPVVSFFTESL